MPETAETLKFKLGLSQLLAVTGPPAKATKCLEAAFTMAADVFEFWLAIQAAFKDVTKKNHIAIPGDVLEKIQHLCNYRFNQIINEAPSNIWVTTFFLVPGTCNDTSNFCLR